MEALTQAARERVLDVLKQGRDMALATIRTDGYPQATTVSYINEGLLLYAGVGLGSQKAANIELNERVSATVTLPYDDWSEIRGISLAGVADFVQGTESLSHIAGIFLRRFPQISRLVPGGSVNPLQSILFVRIRPTVISLLDYRLEFGHTELYQCCPADLANDA